MALRFRPTVKLLPGVRLNLGLHGEGVYSMRLNLLVAGVLIFWAVRLMTHEKPDYGIPSALASRIIDANVAGFRGESISPVKLIVAKDGTFRFIDNPEK
jgi:hypothetical protein